MKIVDSSSSIGRNDLAKYLQSFKTMVKAVIDIEKEKIALDAELHSDLEAHLLASDSKQENLWGINLYPLKDKKNFIEYTALINIRPHQNNPSMEIKDAKVRGKIKRIINKLIDDA
jgi:hypothetical protein